MPTLHSGVEVPYEVSPALQSILAEFARAKRAAKKQIGKPAKRRAPRHAGWTRKQIFAEKCRLVYILNDPEIGRGEAVLPGVQMPANRQPVVYSHALPKYLLIDYIAAQRTINRMSGMMIALGAHTLMADPETSGRGKILVEVLKKASLSSAKRHMLETVFARLGQKKFDATKRLVHNAGMIVDGRGVAIELDPPMIARRRADLVGVEDLIVEVRKLHWELDQAERKAEAIAKAKGRDRVADQKKAPAKGKPGNCQRPPKKRGHKPERGTKAQQVQADLVQRVHERLQADD